MKRNKILLFIAFLTFNQILLNTSFAELSLKPLDKNNGITETKAIPYLEEQVTPISAEIPNDVTSFVQVKVPTNIDFTIDPFEMKEQGQIYAEDYTFINDGDSDVLVTIDQVYCEFSNPDEFLLLSSAEEIRDISPVKELYLYLQNQTSWSEQFEEEYIISNNHNQTFTSFILSSDKTSQQNKAQFKLKGAVNKIPEINWQSNEVTLVMSISFKPITDSKFVASDSDAKPNIEAPTASNSNAKPTSSNNSNYKPNIVLTSEEPQTTSADISQGTEVLPSIDNNVFIETTQATQEKEVYSLPDEGSTSQKSFEQETNPSLE